MIPKHDRHRPGWRSRSVGRAEGRGWTVRGLRATAASAAATLVLAVLPLSPALADPLPADYSGTTHQDVMSLSLTAAGIASIDAAIGHSATAVDSTADPRAHAESANLEAGAVGIPVAVASDEANANNTTPTDSYATGFGTIDVPGVLSIGAINGSGQANWPGDLACVPDGTPIAASTTTMADASIGLTLAGVGVTLLEVGAIETSGSTTLDAGSVVSTSTGNLASLSLLNGLVQVAVLSNPMLTATSDGTTGTVTANDYAVAVTIAGVTTTLTAGASIPINLSIGILTANLTLSVGQLIDTSAGATASGSLSFLSLSGSITAPFIGTVASLDFDILPLSATATAPAGGVECNALDAPTITSPANGETTSETPTITGTGVPGAVVTVTDDGTVIGTAVVGADGTWSLVPTTPLAPGAHTIVATQAADTLVSGPSNAVTFTVVDVTPPAAPVITSPTEGSTVTDATPTITGTGEPGATVEVTIDGTVVGTTTVAPDGTWSFDVPTPLADGTHTITATQTDPAGNVSPASEPVTFTVDAVPPAAPVITSPADGSATNDPTPTITGTGEAGATVEVTVDGTVVGTTTVAADGTWSFDVPTPLADGEHTITATQTDAAGNVSPASDPVTFTVLVPTEPPVITSPADGSVTNDPTPTIAGTGEPGFTVEVSVDDEVVDTTTVGGDGTWSVDLTTPLAEGEHTITATQTDPATGQTSAPSEPVTITVDTTPPPAPVITSPTEGSSTTDTTPTITGTGEPGATVEVRVNGAVVGTATVGPEGTFSVTPARPLPCGEDTITATATDPAGNVSPVSAAVRFTVVCAPGRAAVLPVTGAPLVSVAIFGALMTAAGLWLVRRRWPDGTADD